MKAIPPPYPDWKRQDARPTAQYRVTFWEQPVMEDVPVEQIGWGEVTYDLEDVFSVHEAIAWAEQDAGIRRRPVQSLGRSNP
jgi:hypothetical protein